MTGNYRCGPHLVTALKFDPKAEAWPEGVAGPFKCRRRGCLFYTLAMRTPEKGRGDAPKCELFAGQWVVTFPDGRRITADDSLFHEHFTLLEGEEPGT